MIHEYGDAPNPYARSRTRSLRFPLRERLRAKLRSLAYAAEELCGCFWAWFFDEEGFDRAVCRLLAFVLSVIAVYLLCLALYMIGLSIADALGADVW